MRRLSRGWKIVIGVVCLLLVIGIGAGIGIGASKSSAPQPPAAPTAPANPGPSQPSPTASASDWYYNNGGAGLCKNLTGDFEAISQDAQLQNSSALQSDGQQLVQDVQAAEANPPPAPYTANWNKAMDDFSQGGTALANGDTTGAMQPLLNGTQHLNDLTSQVTNG